MQPLTLALLLLAACSGDDGGPKDDTGGDDSGHGGGGDSGDGNDDVKPSVLGLESLDCDKMQSSGDTWTFTINVDDPQGADTVKSGEVTVLSAEGGELATYVLACGSGQCFGQFRASYDGIGCSLEGEVTLRFVVTDEDGNASDPWDYDTAQG